MSKCGYKNNEVLFDNLRRLLPLVIERGDRSDYNIRTVFHNSGADTEFNVQLTSTGSPGNHSRVCQYEREINPQITLDCGWQYDTKPKGVMKEESNVGHYSIRVIYLFD